MLDASFFGLIISSVIPPIFFVISSGLLNSWSISGDAFSTSLYSGSNLKDVVAGTESLPLLPFIKNESSPYALLADVTKFDISDELIYLNECTRGFLFVNCESISKRQC